MLDLQKNLDKAKSWLLSSGIFINNSSDENCGGVHSFFDVSKNEFGFLYPEITGYFVSTLRFLYSFEKNSYYLEYAKFSANWLKKLFEKYDGIIQGIYNDNAQKLVYSFDTAICAKGLIDYYLMSKDNSYLETAKTLTYYLTNFLESDGTLKPYKNLSTNQFEEDPKLWYKQKGCLHIKVSIPYFQLYLITKENNFLEQGNLICDTFSKFQNRDGSFNLYLNGDTINLHTVCYALEGLLYGYGVTKNENYLKSSERAINWAIQKIEKDGTINLWFNSKYKEKAAYPVAQLVRLMIILDKIQKNNYKNYESILSRFLISLQAESDQKSIQGGFFEGYTKSILGWKKIPRINSWTSMFAIQAMYWSENYEKLCFEDMIEFLY